jgi:phosphate transport system substrate-binding protein
VPVNGHRRSGDAGFARNPPGTGTALKKTTIGLICLTLLLPAAASARKTAGTDIKISGAGSTLVEPLVDQWVSPLSHTFGYAVSYAGVGSGTGIADISARTVDFGASDAPLTPDQAKTCHACIEIPWALSATTLSYNVPGVVNDLHLSGPTIAGIFPGRITNWDDPTIRKLNPKLTLPNLAITSVHRSDGSGDTYAFTDYLAKVSPQFKSQVGNATLVNWPGGIGAKGNSGVAGVIKTNSGAIGYISAAYLFPNHLKVAAIENAHGAFALPGLRGIASAAEAFPKATLGPNGVEMHIVDPPKTAKKNAYPIATYTYVIVPTSTAKATELRKLIFWGLTQGQAYGPKLIFSHIPRSVLVADERALDRIRAT